MPLILGTNSIKDTGFDVANSVNCGDESTRWSGSAKVTSTSQQKGSWNIWLKRTVLGAQGLFKVYEAANTGVEFGFDSSDQFFMKEFESGSDVFNLKTSAVFRDTSAWMNILLAIDTTQGTEANRIRLYINGVEPSLATSTRPSVNTNLVRFFANGSDSSGQQHEMGNNYDGATGHYLLTQILYVDGTQLANTDVGEFDEDSGIWKPIDISETTLGNNGYYLSMEDSSNFGTATGKSFTAHGFTATDSRTDTCTNNEATFNPLGKANLTYAEGNTKITNASGAHNGSLSTIAVNKGKWYYEVKFIDGSQTRSMAGICKVTDNLDNEYVGDTANSYGYFRSNGNKFNNSVSSSYGSTPSNNDIISVAFDADNGAVWFALNGSWQNSATKSEIEAGTTTNAAFSSITMDDFFAFACSGEDATCQANFGSPSYTISSGNTDGNGYGNFEYAVPSGYYALNTKNLAEYG